MSNQTKSNGLFVLVALIGLFAGINLVNSAWSFIVDKNTNVNVIAPTGTIEINGALSTTLDFGSLESGGSKTITVSVKNTSNQVLMVSVDDVNTTGFDAYFDEGSVILGADELASVDLTLTCEPGTEAKSWGLVISFDATTL